MDYTTEKIDDQTFIMSTVLETGHTYRHRYVDKPLDFREATFPKYADVMTQLFKTLEPKTQDEFAKLLAHAQNTIWEIKADDPTDPFDCKSYVKVIKEFLNYIPDINFVSRVLIIAGGDEKKVDVAVKSYQFIKQYQPNRAMAQSLTEVVDNQLKQS